jgi:hypothetical protein
MVVSALEEKHEFHMVDQQEAMVVSDDQSFFKQMLISPLL